MIPPERSRAPRVTEDGPGRAVPRTINLVDPEVDAHWMRMALAEAEKARAIDEVPIGCVMVKNDQIIASGYNQRESLRNALSHAELEAIDRACTALASWRLLGVTLYVTLEPCLMCAGAIWQARLDRVVFGAFDPKAGAMGSLYRVHEDERLNHRLPVTGGVLAEECGEALRQFFRAKRG